MSASAFYQPDLLGPSYRGLHPGSYALLLFDLSKREKEGEFMLPAPLQTQVADCGGQLDLNQQDVDAISVAMYLPLCEDSEAADAATAGEPAELHIGDSVPHVLLVDDNESIQSTVGEMLRRLGYHVTVRAGGIEALDAIRRDPDRFQLVLTDVTMPRVSGLEMLARLRAIRSDLPVLLMTGFSFNSLSEQTLASATVLQKPFTLAKLKDSVAQALADGP